MNCTNNHRFNQVMMIGDASHLSNAFHVFKMSSFVNFELPIIWSILNWMSSFADDDLERYMP